MPFNLLKIYDICKSDEALLQQLQDWRLVPSYRNCPSCENPMKLLPNKEDGWMWRCKNKIVKRKQSPKECGKMIRFRTGTFFARSHLSYFQGIKYFLNFLN